MPNKVPQTIQKTTTVRLPRDWDFKAIAQTLDLSQSELIRISVKAFAESKGLII